MTVPPSAAAPSRPTSTLHARALLRAALLAAWLGVVLLAWLAINVGMEDPGSADETFTGLWPPNHPYWFNPLIALVALAPAAWLGVSVARASGARTKVGSAGIAFALGVICWSLGNLVWFWYNTCTAWAVLGCSTAIEAPYPSIADVGFLLLLPCWAFGMVQLARVLATTLGDLVRLAWIPVVAFAATGYIVLPPVELFGVTIPNQSALFDSGYTTAQTIFSIIYVVSDCALLSFALMILIRSRAAAGGWFFVPMLVASTALLLQYAADIVFDVRVAEGIEYAGDIADLLYFFALFTMIVALHRIRGVQASMELELERMTLEVAAEREGVVA